MEIYEGNWEKGVRSGRGKLEIKEPSGRLNTYQGFSDDNVLIRGTLIQKYSNFEYYGGAVDGRRHGLGVLKTSTAKWEGVFEKGRFKNGYVERTFRDGSKYEGNWLHNNING